MTNNIDNVEFIPAEGYEPVQGEGRGGYAADKWYQLHDVFIANSYCGSEYLEVPAPAPAPAPQENNQSSDRTS